MFNSGVKVNELAVLFGVSNVTIYRKMKKLKKVLQPFLFKEKGITFITPEGVELIKADVQEGNTAGVNTNEDNTFASDKHVEQVNEILVKQLSEKQKIIDSLLNQLNEQRQRSDTIIMKMSNDLSNAVKAIEGSRAEIRMLEHRMSEAAERNQVPEAEPVHLKGGWMRKFGNWLFELGSTDSSGQAPDIPYRDFRYL